MTRAEALKRAEENLRQAENILSVLSASDRAMIRTRIARGWIDLAQELDRNR